MRVAVVAEYYPRPSHPGLGIWAHRQAVAVGDQGVEVDVIALERPIPPINALRSLLPGRGGPDPRQLREWLRDVREQPRESTFDGVRVRYVRFLSPPRPMSYGQWGRWAAPAVGNALEDLARSGPLDLVHAHYAVPAGDASRRWMAKRGRALPLVVSVHGGDLTYAAPRSKRGWEVVAGTLREADAVVVNSEVTRKGVERLIGSKHELRVIHPGADVGDRAGPRNGGPALITVANLEPHKSQADVIRALAKLVDRYPALRYVLVGKGPQRYELEELARSVGVADRVEFCGALPHEAARKALARCDIHVMPSRHDGFGVAHIDAMGLGIPTIGGAGTGAEDIAMAGEGILLVQAGNVDALAGMIDDLLRDPTRRFSLGDAGRKTVAEHFSWKRNGELTAAVYREAVEKRS